MLRDSTVTALRSTTQSWEVAAEINKY